MKQRFQLDHANFDDTNQRACMFSNPVKLRQFGQGFMKSEADQKLFTWEDGINDKY